MLTTTEPIVDHDLAGSTMGDISDFVRTNETQLKELNISTLSWIIIDQNGLDCSSCILMHRQYDVEKMEMSHKFKAIRMPFIETWIMYANLDVANMDFEEWLDEDAGLQDDGTYKWIGPFPPSNEGLVQAEKEKEAKREACLKVAKDLGYIE
jgi:hypothetical protein